MLLLSSRLFDLHSSRGGCSHSGSHGRLCRLVGSELGSALIDSLVVAVDLTSILLLKVHANFIVDEGENHAIMERNQRGRLVVVHLLLALHEHECSIGRRLLLASLRDEPTLVVIVSDIAVVSRDSLEFNLDFTLH